MKYIHNLQEIGVAVGSKVLVVFPHPDDEAAFTGGFIQKAGELRVKVRLVVLTRGEASTLKYGVHNGESLADVRQRELVKATGLLGTRDIKVYEMPDGGLENEVEKVKQVIEAEMVQYQPDYVVTYEPSGVYGHPDHIVVSQVITDIYNQRGHIFKLIYATIKPGYVHSPDSLKMARDPASLKPLEPTFALVLSPMEILRKLRSLGLHKSQFKPSVKESLRWLKNGLWRVEYYTFV